MTATGPVQHGENGGYLVQLTANDLGIGFASPGEPDDWYFYPTIYGGQVASKGFADYTTTKYLPGDLVVVADLEASSPGVDRHDEKVVLGSLVAGDADPGLDPVTGLAAGTWAEVLPSDVIGGPQLGSSVYPTIRDEQGWLGYGAGTVLLPGQVLHVEGGSVVDSVAIYIIRPAAGGRAILVGPPPVEGGFASIDGPHITGGGLVGFQTRYPFPAAPDYTASHTVTITGYRWAEQSGWVEVGGTPNFVLDSPPALGGDGAPEILGTGVRQTTGEDNPTPLGDWLVHGLGEGTVAGLNVIVRFLEERQRVWINSGDEEAQGDQAKRIYHYFARLRLMQWDGFGNYLTTSAGIGLEPRGGLGDLTTTLFRWGGTEAHGGTAVDGTVWAGNGHVWKYGGGVFLHCTLAGTDGYLYPIQVPFTEPDAPAVGGFAILYPLESPTNRGWVTPVGDLVLVTHNAVVRGTVGADGAGNPIDGYAAHIDEDLTGLSLSPYRDADPANGGGNGFAHKIPLAGPRISQRLWFDETLRVRLCPNPKTPVVPCLPGDVMGTSNGVVVAGTEPWIVSLDADLNVTRLWWCRTMTPGTWDAAGVYTPASTLDYSPDCGLFFGVFPDGLTVLPL